MYEIDDLLTVMTEAGASDMFITLGAFPMLTINGEVVPLEKETITLEILEKLKSGLLSDEQLEKFTIEKDLDYTYSLSGVGRYRINFFRQRNSDAFVVRRISQEIQSLEELGLPSILGELTLKEHGLILVVGATGSGKSTTLASMIDHYNQNKSGHILTLEDPIEFLHKHKKCVINQREIGQDTKSYQRAIHSAVREAPSLLLLGEIRDEVTMSAALNFAETGHLVLSTLHSTNTVQTLERILGFFDASKHDIVSLQLSQTLVSIVAQRLIPSVDNKRIPAMEILLSTERVRDLLRNGEVDLLRNTIAESSLEDMCLFDQSLYNLYHAQKITEETALHYADRPTDLLLKFRMRGRKKNTEKIKLEDENYFE